MKALLIVMFLFALTAGLHALEIYLRRTVVLQSNRPALRELVYVLPGDAGAAALDAVLPFEVNRPTLLPAAAVREALLDGVSGPVIVSGGRVALVPPSLAAPRESLFYRDFLEYLDASERDRSSRIELEIIEPPVTGDYDGGLKKHFELRELGDVTEVGYPTQSGRPRSFRIKVHRFSGDARPTAPEAAGVAAPGIQPAAGQDPRRSAAAAGRPRDAGVQPEEGRELALRSGERIRIRFVRGSVTVTLPGRALRSGYSGETVPVRPFDGEQSYDALVTGKREVLVELR